ncbi:hypothetical protein SAMN05421642_112112 [Rhodococcoides kyotonense]|uniref:Histidine kinase n=2 Tax=Rhodococcoides kyotonense TaxID=398843 RepID=A0A239L7W0_9NOCA|nr:hypothetical protein SAMN05421642_112112 [Rhodococcus kyotonensis]
MTGHDGEDIRDLIGIRSRAAYWIVGFYTLAAATCALSTLNGVDPIWPVAVALCVIAAGALFVVTTPGDPLPRRAALALSAVGPITCSLVFVAIPVPLTSPLQTWPLGMSVVIYTFMCVRGRTPLAWLGLLMSVAATVVWAVATDQGAWYGLSYSLINAAPLLMATFFTFTIRPLGRSIFELRRQSTERIAAQAAAAAVLEERDVQLERLDELARPLLERAVSGPDLGPEEQMACIILEADLRDSLRARRLADPVLQESVRAARRRGVGVVLLDDRADAELDADVRATVVESVARCLNGLENGSATIRLLPPGRPVLATMLVDAQESTYRVEYANDGSASIP